MKQGLSQIPESVRDLANPWFGYHTVTYMRKGMGISRYIVKRYILYEKLSWKYVGNNVSFGDVFIFLNFGKTFLFKTCIKGTSLSI